MAATAPEADPVELASAFLRDVRSGESTDRIRARLADMDPDGLAAALVTDHRKRAFWLNLYNATVQHLLATDPERYERKRRFFGADSIRVAGHDLSLDDVEHGLLRRSRFKYSLGYLANPFPGAFERRFRVRELDPRIHFALNCGAASCPPIATYSARTIDDQLQAATAAYLETEVTHEPDRGVVRVPRLFLWYRGDFGGKSDILELLRVHDRLPEDASPRLEHEPYDWTRRAGHFRDR